MGDFLAFRKMITPYVIQIVFWIGLLAIVVGSVGAISQDQALAGLLILTFGALYWRIVCEFIIVFFRMNDSLRSINAHTATIPPALASRGLTPDAGGPPTADSAGVADPAESVSRAEAVAAPVAASATVASIPEGWYDDSSRPGHTRWWDGTTWGIRDDEHPSAPGASPETDTEIAAPAAESPPETGEGAGPSAPESASAPPARFCENCGAERSPDSRFCTNCGHA